jgi:hypothetical protein
MILPGAALASPLAPTLPPGTIQPPKSVQPPGKAQPALPVSPRAEGTLISVAGMLEYVTDLETPHYEVGGWAIILNSPALPRLVGKPVSVTGTLFGGISILMKPQVVVSELQVSLMGALTHITDVEAPHYELDGFVLKAADAVNLTAMEGQTVSVTGTLVIGPSIDMKPVIAVTDAWAAGTRIPSAVVVSGVAPAFPTRVRLVGGHLMLPLRAIIEAAGGKLGWDGQAMAVRISLAGRSALIKIGQAIYSNGELPVPPFLQDECTLAPVELLADLGLTQRWDGSILYLELAPKAQRNEQ